MGVRNYRDLVAWQKAMELALAAYCESGRFPKHEIFGLTSQLRRAAVAVPSNIAEGQGRTTTRDFLNFLSIANGSLKEVETHVLLAERLAYIPHAVAQLLLSLTDEVGRLLHGLMAALRKKSS
jgi:four helix bundle protein